MRNSITATRTSHVKSVSCALRLWVAPSSGTCFYGDHTLPTRATHAPWARACKVGPAHARVSGQLRRGKAGRQGDTGEACGFFPARGPGEASCGPRRYRGQPWLPVVVAAAGTVGRGVFKDRNPGWAGGGGRGSEGRRAAGIADIPGVCVGVRPPGSRKLGARDLRVCGRWRCEGILWPFCIHLPPPAEVQSGRGGA